MAVSYQKIVLSKQGEQAKLNLDKKENKIKKINVKISWTKGVDLDLHAFYLDKDGYRKHIYFGEKESNLVTLDKDSGVGNTSGNNEENLTVKDIDGIDYILFAVNIFRFFGFLNKGENFAKYDGKILFSTNVSQIEVPLNSDKIGKWAVIALVDNNDGEAKVKNINDIRLDEPKIEDYI